MAFGEECPDPVFQKTAWTSFPLRPERRKTEIHVIGSTSVFQGILLLAQVEGVDLVRAQVACVENTAVGG